MRKFRNFVALAALFAFGSAGAMAAPAQPKTVAVPAQLGAFVLPLPGKAPGLNPGNVIFAKDKDLKWYNDPAYIGELQANLFGDPSKPGMYGILVKWPAGQFSRPHFHSQDRFVYVVSGTWWVSSDDVFDPSKTTPMPAGSFVVDLGNKVHWDGAKKETGDTVLELVGMGPVISEKVNTSDPRNKQ
jgi:hypothetical protein